MFKMLPRKDFGTKDLVGGLKTLRRADNRFASVERRVLHVRRNARHDAQKPERSGVIFFCAIAQTRKRRGQYADRTRLVQETVYQNGEDCG